MNAGFGIRTYQRFGVCGLCEYVGVNVTGEGFVSDLSTTAIRVTGNRPVPPGIVLLLRLFLPDGSDPLVIEHGVVQRVRDREFVLCFTVIGKQEQICLDRFIGDLAQQQDT